MPDTQPTGQPQPDQDGEKVWVISDLAPDGTYVCTLHYGPDVAVVLDRDQATAHAIAAHAVAARADYLGALWRMLREGMGMADDLAASLLRDMIAELPPLDRSATDPLDLEPYLSATWKTGMVRIRVRGELVGQWTPADARSHASKVLDVSQVVDLDAALRRLLVGPVGLDQGRAGAIVHSLGDYRDKPEGGEA